MKRTVAVILVLFITLFASVGAATWQRSVASNSSIPPLDPKTLPDCKEVYENYKKLACAARIDEIHVYYCCEGYELLTEAEYGTKDEAILAEWQEWFKKLNLDACYDKCAEVEYGAVDRFRIRVRVGVDVLDLGTYSLSCCNIYVNNREHIKVNNCEEVRREFEGLLQKIGY